MRLNWQSQTIFKTIIEILEDSLIQPQFKSSSVSSGVGLLLLFLVEFIWLLALIWSQPRHPLGLEGWWWCVWWVTHVGLSPTSLPLESTSHNIFHMYSPPTTTPSPMPSNFNSLHHQPMCYRHSKLKYLLLSMYSL